MAMTIKQTNAKAGREYTVTNNGAQNIEEHYQVLLREPLGIREVPTSFEGVPAIGTEHPNRPGLYASRYRVVQPPDIAKHTLDVYVEYTATDYSTETIPGTTPSEDVEQETQILEWGWDDGTAEKELTTDVVDGRSVLNSAGDPFESVPMHTTPSPTFTKVFRSTSRLNYWDYVCKVNEQEMTIGNVTCAAHTLLCSVSERMIVGQTNYPYEYTVHLRYKTNIVKGTIKTGDSPSSIQDNATLEVGWDVAIIDAGMRALDSDGIPQMIQAPSSVTNEMATVTSPELLNGLGGQVTRTTGETPKAVILIFHGYGETNFPDWMTSEPTVTTPTALAWKPNTVYHAGDKVRHGKYASGAYKIWTCVDDHTSGAVFEPVYWSLDDE